VIKVGEQKELRERNAPGSQLLAKVQHKATLHFHDDVRKTFGVGTNVVVCRSGKRSSWCGIQTPLK
jgi:hypothetical protein